MVSLAPEDGFIAVQFEPPGDPNGLITPVPKDPDSPLLFHVHHLSLGLCQSIGLRCSIVKGGSHPAKTSAGRPSGCRTPGSAPTWNQWVKEKEEWGLDVDRRNAVSLRPPITGNRLTLPRSWNTAPSRVSSRRKRSS